MRLIMTKTLLLLFSVFMLSGCVGTCPPPLVVVSSPELIYPDYNTSKPFKVHGKKINGKIVLEPSEFKRISTKIIEQTYAIKTLHGIIDTGNHWEPNLTEKK